MSGEFAHQSVLLEESLEALNIRADGTYLDATFGRGGHSRAILNKLNSKGRLYAIDRDPQAIATGRQLEQQDPRFTLFHSPFSALESLTHNHGIQGQIDGILMDLGVSSPQLDDASRGFSFLRDGPLDMRMDTTRGVSAAEWLLHADEQDIAQVIKEFGEEKFGKRIAHAIVNSRDEHPLTTTHQLAALIDDAVPVKDKYKHPATRAFQGIRIYINSELDEVRDGLKGALAALCSGGRLAVISFHSLEDRMVKRFMREQSRGTQFPAGLPVTDSQIDAGKAMKLVGKAIKPSQQEIDVNPRSRSSVLRIAEKL